MKIRTIKINYMLNAFRVISGALISIVTMPYINKTLGAKNLGSVEYVNTIVNYFLLFSALGIPMYGIREIGKIRDNIKETTKTVIELLVILFATSMISYLLLFGVLYQLAFFDNYKDLILLMSSMILLSNMGAEWYFQGMEDQVYITVRYVIVRLIALALLFYIVQDSSDYLNYALIVVLTICGSNFFNLFYLFKTIDFKNLKFESLNFKRHLRPVLTIFIASISINIYLQLDNFLIGSIAGDNYLGYYVVSNKLIRVVISFIIIVGAVLLPRLSNLYIVDKEQYYDYLRNAFTVILIIGLPSTVVFMAYAENIIIIMGGADFIPSIITMQILSPLCVVVGIAYFIGYLVLYTQNKEKIYTKAVLFSAVFSISVNFFAITKYQQNGAAVVAVLSEILAVVLMFFFAQREIRHLKILNINFAKIIYASVFMAVISFTLVNFINLSNVIIFALAITTSLLTFIFSLIIFKENLTISLLVKLNLIIKI